MPTKYICDHCNKEPLYLKNGRCPACGNEATKLHIGIDLSSKQDLTMRTANHETG